MRHLMNGLCGLALAGSFLLSAATAHAQQAPQAAQGSKASGKAKGIVGGALLGGEVTLLIEAAADVKPAWAYIVGGVAGAAAGGVGGFFVEDHSAEAAVYMLAGGMALVIPTTVAVLSTTAYEPPADYVEDTGPTDEPVANPPEPAGAPAPPAAAPATPAEPSGGATGSSSHAKRHRTVAKKQLPVSPPALVGYDEGLLKLSVPPVEVRNVYTPEERQKFGVAQATEVRVPVVSVVF